MLYTLKTFIWHFGKDKTLGGVEEISRTFEGKGNGLDFEMMNK